MCGRYVLKTPVPELQELLGFENAPPHRPRYNIAPRQDVLVVRAGGQAPPAGRASRPDPPDDRRRWAELMRWGLIPSWADDPQFVVRRACNSFARAMITHYSSRVQPQQPWLRALPF